MKKEVKEISERTRDVTNSDKSKKYLLRGGRNARYHDRIPCKPREKQQKKHFKNKKRSYIVNIFIPFKSSFF